MPILWDEPFGLVMAEAMACGTPIIGLRRGAVPEVVEDGSPASLPMMLTARCGAWGAYMKSIGQLVGPVSSCSF